MKNKKKKKLLIVIASLFLLIILIIFSLLDPVPEQVKEMVSDNIEDYEKIAKICLEDYQQYDVNKILYMFGNGHFTGTIFLDDGVHENYQIDLSEDEVLSYENIEKNYDKQKRHLGDKSLEFIWVYDNFVSFSNLSAGGSIIYSLDGEKPKYLENPDEDLKHVSVRKITDHWYYAYSERFPRL